MIFSKFIAGVFLGAVAGAAAAYFFQTEKGKEVLNEIKGAAKDAGRNFKSNFRNFEDEMNELLKKGKKFVNDLENKAKRAASSF